MSTGTGDPGTPVPNVDHVVDLLSEAIVALNLMMSLARSAIRPDVDDTSIDAEDARTNLRLVTESFLNASYGLSHAHEWLFKACEERDAKARERRQQKTKEKTKEAAGG